MRGDSPRWGGPGGAPILLYLSLLGRICSSAQSVSVAIPSPLVAVQFPLLLSQNNPSVPSLSDARHSDERERHESETS